jgi:hypothetical protein
LKTGSLMTVQTSSPVTAQAGSRILKTGSLMTVKAGSRILKAGKQIAVPLKAR